MKSASLLLFLAACLAQLPSNGYAIQIYGEDFTGQEGKGSSGPTPASTDVAGVDWSVDISNASLTGVEDYFRVENGQFVGRDLDGFATWSSPVINTAGFSNISFSLDALEEGDMEGSGSVDFFDVSYSVDGGAPVLVENWSGAGDSNHTLIGDRAIGGAVDDADWVSTTVSEGGLGGSTLQIFVTMQNFAGNEFMFLDNVVVSGDAAVAVPEGSATGVFAIVCAGMMLRRRTRR